MNKFFGMIALVAMLIFVTTNADAQGRNGKGNNNNGNHGQVNFIDTDGDGICDNFVDSDGDGKCDHCAGLGSGTGFIDEDGDGKCDNAGTGKRGNGTRFIDADGDGVCDNFTDADGDGKCDNCTGLGSGFIDEDGDGKCDNAGLGQNGAGKGQGKNGKGNGKRLRDGSCDFDLEQNYPNPVNGNTSLNLNISEAKYGTINLYDYSGNKVAEVFKGNLNSGDNIIDYQPVNMKSGVYYYTVEIDGQISTKKMIIK